LNERRKKDLKIQKERILICLLVVCLVIACIKLITPATRNWNGLPPPSEFLYDVQAMPSAPIETLAQASYIMQTDGYGNYSAVEPDGTVAYSGTNCTLVRQEAGNALGPNGGVIAWLNGTFYTDSTIMSPTNISDVGEGTPITVIERTTDHPIFALKQYEGVSTDRQSNTICNMRLNGNGYHSDIIYASQIAQSTFENIEFFRFTGNGIEINGSHIGFSFYNSYINIMVGGMQGLVNNGAVIYSNAFDWDSQVRRMTGSGNNSGLIGFWKNGGGNYVLDDLHIDATKNLIRLETSQFYMVSNTIENCFANNEQESGIVININGNDMWNNRFLNNEFDGGNTSADAILINATAGNFYYNIFAENTYGATYLQTATYRWAIDEVTSGKGWCRYDDFYGNYFKSGLAGLYNLTTADNQNIGDDPTYVSLPIPTVSAWNVPPSNLGNAVDGNWATFAGTATSTTITANQTFGNIIFDMKVVKTVALSAKLGLWSNSSSATIYVYLYYSLDGVRFIPVSNSYWASVRSTSESVVITPQQVVNARAIELSFVCDTSNVTCFLNCYEVHPSPA
jgi:hypothetical protein